MGPNDVLAKGFVADTAIPLYHVVEQTDVEHCGLVNEAGADVLGVCQEEIDGTDATVGRVVQVRIMGISRCVADSAIPMRSKVRAAADGRVTGLAAATDGQNVVGVALTPTTAAGDWVDVMLTPGNSADVSA